MKGNDKERLVATRQGSKNGDAGELEYKGPDIPWAFVTVFFMLIGVFLFLWWSPMFCVKSYAITGISRVKRDEVLARCAQWSDNIFALDLEKIERSLEACPWIERATCSKKLPDTLQIHIVERVPIAFAPIDGVVWLIDKDGRVLEEDDGTSAELIALTGIQGPVAPGQFLSSPECGWALEVILGIGPVTRSKMIEVNVQSEECSIILDDGCKVFMGKEKADSETVLAVLESILCELESEDRIAEYIDLRFDKQAVKLR